MNELEKYKKYWTYNLYRLFSSTYSVSSVIYPIWSNGHVAYMKEPTETNIRSGGSRDIPPLYDTMEEAKERLLIAFKEWYLKQCDEIDKIGEPKAPINAKPRCTTKKSE